MRQNIAQFTDAAREVLETQERDYKRVGMSVTNKDRAEKLALMLHGLGEIEPRPVVAIDVDRELIERTGLGAKLPPHFHWGADAMEQFEVGKRRAVEAILALVGAPP